MNIGEPWPDLDEAEYRVHATQTKLHQWAISDPGRRFDDLYNLVYDPAFLVVAWSRVRDNEGGRSAGVDGVVPRSIVFSAGEFLAGLRDDLKARRFIPVRVREKMIPKANGKVRRLGIPTAADRTVQASLKLVLEPIFEADFKPCSYGFRPKRRAQDAIAEIHFFGTPVRNYEWVFEADIKACFDEIDHTALMGRVRRRIGDRRVLGLVKAFLKSGILGEDGVDRDDDHRHAPRRHPLAPARKHCPVGPRRSFRPRRGRHSIGRTPAEASSPRARPIPPRPLRGRLRGPGGGHRELTLKRLGRRWQGARSDGSSPLGREDEDRPYR